MTTGGRWGTHSPERCCCCCYYYYHHFFKYICISNYNNFHTNENPWLEPAGIRCCRHAPKLRPTQRSHRKRWRHIPGHAQVWMLLHPHWYPRALGCELWGMGCKPPQRTLSHSPATPKPSHPQPSHFPKAYQTRKTHRKLSQNNP